jgi:hypothetical protein
MNEAGGYDAFALYHGLKLHFTTNYDYVKYNGKISIGKDSFMLRKDKFFFYKLSRKYKEEELRGFYIANLLIKPKIWVAELLSEDCDSEYKVWMRTQQSLSYIFEQDLIKAFDTVNNPEELLKVVDGQYPLLYNLYLQEKVHLETIIILNDYMNFLPMWLRKIDDDIIFPEFVKKCGKYKPFIYYDVVKFKGILKEQICQLA